MQAISALCQKYPRKHSVMMTFLSNMLRDDVSGTFALGEGFGDAKEVGQSDYNTSVGSDLCEMLSGISDGLGVAA